MTAESRADERGHRLAVLGSVALIVVFQLVGAAVLDTIFLDTDDRARNYAYRRLWPDYVLSAPPKRDGETLLLLISNSQGYGPEMPERMIYPVLLADALTERMGRPVRIENWSVLSGNATEFALLSATAHRIQPDVTLMMMSPRNFSQKFRWRDGVAQGLDFGLPDVRRLAAYSDVRANLPERFRDFYLGPNELLDATLGRVMPLWRYRDLPRVIPNQYPPLRRFAKGTAQQHWLYENPEQPRGKNNRKRDLPVPVISWELVDETAAAFATVPGRRIFVRMPTHSETNTDFGAFLRRAGPRFAATGADVWDLGQAVEDDAFLSESHLNQHGHAQLAQLLAERLSE